MLLKNKCFNLRLNYETGKATGTQALRCTASACVTAFSRCLIPEALRNAALFMLPPVAVKY
jgi:hypothetical protein